MSVEYTEHKARRADNLALTIHTWRGDVQPVHQLLIVHGYAEHGARYREYAHYLADRGVHVVAPDLRGHGLSDGRRGHVDDYGEYFLDVEEAKRYLIDGIPTTLLGHSNGGLIVLDYLSTSDRGFSSAILSNPYLGLALDVPAPKVWAGKFAGAFLPRLAMPSGLDADGLSHDKEIVKRYRRDPYVFSTVTAGWFRESSSAQGRVKAMASLPLPFMYMYSDSDPIASPADNRDLAHALTGPEKKVIERRGELHEILNEVDRQSLYAETFDWISKH